MFQLLIQDEPDKLGIHFPMLRQGIQENRGVFPLQSKYQSLGVGPYPAEPFVNFHIHPSRFGSRLGRHRVHSNNLSLKQNVRSRLISLITMALMALTLSPALPTLALVSRSGTKQRAYNQQVTIYWNSSGTVQTHTPSYGGVAHRWRGINMGHENTRFHCRRYREELAQARMVLPERNCIDKFWSSKLFISPNYSISSVLIRNEAREVDPVPYTSFSQQVRHM